MIAENIVTNLYAKFNYNWLWNEKVLGNWKSTNNNKSAQEEERQECS